MTLFTYQHASVKHREVIFGTFGEPRLQCNGADNPFVLANSQITCFESIKQILVARLLRENNLQIFHACSFLNGPYSYF